MRISDLCDVAKGVKDDLVDIQTIAASSGYADVTSLVGHALTLMTDNTFLSRVLQGWDNQ